MVERRGKRSLGNDVIFAVMPSFLRRQYDLLFMSEVAEARCSVAKQRRELAGSMFATICVLSRNGRSSQAIEPPP